MTPVFIVGSPRSGTTLMRLALDRHPKIAICDEINYFYYAYSRRKAFGDLADEDKRRYLVKKYLELPLLKRLNLPDSELTLTLMQEGTSYSAFLLSLIRFNAKYKGKEIAGEKTPHNSLFTNLLCDWFPDCTIIHMIRDPRDCVASLMRMPWSRRNVLGNARLYVNYNRAAKRDSNQKNYCPVRYEDLATKPEEELRRVLSFIGTDFSSELLSPGEDENDGRWWNARAHGTIGEDRVGKWRHELSSNEIAIIERITGELIDEFGYESTNAQLSTSAYLAALGRERIDSMRGKLLNARLYWYHWFQPTQLAAIDRSWQNAAKPRKRDQTISQ